MTDEQGSKDYWDVRLGIEMFGMHTNMRQKKLDAV